MQPGHLLDQVHRCMDVLNHIGMVVRALDDGVESLDDVIVVGAGEIIWMDRFDRFGRIEGGHCVMISMRSEMDLYMSTGE